MEAAVWVIILPLLTAFFLGIFKYYFKKIFFPLVTGSAIIYLFLLILVIQNSDSPNVYSVGGWGRLGINLMVDPFSTMFLLIIALLFLPVIIFSLKYINITHKHTYFIFTYLMIAGIAGMVLTTDLFNLYVFLEVSSLSSIALTALKNTDKGIEGTFKYLLTSTLGSFFILLATILTYYLTGTLNMAEISLAFIDIPFKIKSTLMAFFVFGYSIKIGLIPIHAWLPDAYEDSPIPYNVLSSGLVMKSAVYALIRVLYIIFGIDFLKESGMLNIGVFWGVITFLIAHSLAYQQSNLVRLLAYSSIAQIAYITIGFFVGSESGLIAGSFHILNHAIMKGTLFFVAGIFSYSVSAVDIKDIKGLGYKFPVLSFTFVVASLAIVGLPPFNGFMSKWLIVEAALEAGYVSAAFFILVGTFLSLTYYLKVIITLYTKEEKQQPMEEPGLTLKLPTIFVGSLCIVFGIVPSLPLHLLNKIPNYLLDNGEYIRILLGG
ncbi:proton-conducting membrane transporter [Bacillus luteolus]|uniref:Proton-conducting membrane transporter n=1 Tax=Litchfieldia luteola TaxID=682179 RepID=A0ABR9QDB1_9BACI|nr:proton-conducting transporter membrane subunit [Cytobacillus luteolus]MBE4906485.1 proton-conducting membrane transporter [Cytobacillus luteolus]MBP1941168.1 proton-translocating NADH-quinone oxidoreductase chain N [Cytobacillus luteolus]